MKFEQVHPESPCNTCEKREECREKCGGWVLWFRLQWQAVRRVFLK